MGLGVGQATSGGYIAAHVMLGLWQQDCMQCRQHPGRREWLSPCLWGSGRLFGTPGNQRVAQLEGEAIRGAGLLLAVTKEVHLCLNLGSPQKQRLE